MSQQGLRMKYFVLKPLNSNGHNDVYSRASRIAMRVYAGAIMEDNPGFAKEILEWVDNVEKQLEGG